MVGRIFGLTWVEASLLAIGLVALAVEVVAAVVGDPLISPTMRHDGARWMLWPAGWGVLGGHFYGPLVTRPAWGPYVLIGVGVIILGRDLFLRTRLSPAGLCVVFLAGAVAGAIFWAQTK